MVNILDKLYPDEASDFKVIENIPIREFQLEKNAKKVSIDNVDEFYGERLLKKFAVKDGDIIDKLAFINKLNPHSLYDMMILAADELPKSSISDLARSTAKTLLEIAYNFLQFIANEDNIRKYKLDNGRFHFCYNYDRDTIDRESGMAEKRFHLHLNYWTQDEHIPEKIIKVADINKLSWRRRLLDPISFLGPQIAYDVLGGEVAGIKLLEPDNKRDANLGLPVGLKIKFDNWSVLNEEFLINILRELHSKIFDTYDLLSIAFTGEKNTAKKWERNRLLDSEQIISNIQNIDWLSNESREGLIILAKSLKNIKPNTMNYLKKHKDYRVRHLSMGGLNYSLGLFCPGTNSSRGALVDQGPVYLVFQTKMFADLGGAGISYMGNIPIVRINRGIGVFSEDEVLMRNDFHAQFISFCTNKLKNDLSLIW